MHEIAMGDAATGGADAAGVLSIDGFISVDEQLHGGIADAVGGELKTCCGDFFDELLETFWSDFLHAAILRVTDAVGLADAPRFDHPRAAGEHASIEIDFGADDLQHGVFFRQRVLDDFFDGFFAGGPEAHAGDAGRRAHAHGEVAFGEHLLIELTLLEAGISVCHGCETDGVIVMEQFDGAAIGVLCRGCFGRGGCFDVMAETAEQAGGFAIGIHLHHAGAAFGHFEVTAVAAELERKAVEHRIRSGGKHHRIIGSDAVEFCACRVKI